VKPEYLIEMANDISAFFAPGRASAQAAAEVATHIQRYWDPRMRREIVAAWRAGAPALSAVAGAAVALLAAQADARGAA
jgi:formate dehydrogenase subunit delta